MTTTNSRQAILGATTSLPLGALPAQATNPDAARLAASEAVPLAHSIEAAAHELGIGRTKVFELIRTGRLLALRYGRRTLIPEEALRAFLASLPHV